MENKNQILGAVYSPEATSFCVWAPQAKEVELFWYSEGTGNDLLGQQVMSAKEDGTWECRVEKDIKNVYYEYHIRFQSHETITGDPYAKAAGVNGVRSMVVDLASTNPEGWASDSYAKLEKPTDAIICEISVRDMTADENSGVKNKGKYLGLTEENTKSKEGMSTGLTYLKELGITHVQLMPSYDFGSIDESKPLVNQYNWGYDPVNYNVPEGSYSTDPYHGEVRVREFKEMVKAFHKNGLGVIMDVVYNHTFDVENNVFQKTAPDAYYRLRADHTYSDASACGNEVASDREQVRKYIVDSVVYWTSEYHIDGFRFDLMGVLDIETMRQIEKEVHAINPDALLYGEGWAGGPSVLSEDERALKKNLPQIPNFGAFSDDIRDTVRGHVFTDTDKGFVAGAPGLCDAVKFSVVGSCKHPQVKATDGKCSDSFWALSPANTVNYVSCHDNFTLWDKLVVSNPTATKEQLMEMNKLAAYIVFTSQGIPFFLSGEEFGRTKPVEGESVPSENSYNLPISTNKIDYSLAWENRDLIAYYKDRIAFRKKHPSLRIADADALAKALTFVETEDGSVAFHLSYEGDELDISYRPSFS